MKIILSADSSCNLIGKVQTETRHLKKPNLPLFFGWFWVCLFVCLFCVCILFVWLVFCVFFRFLGGENLLAWVFSLENNKQPPVIKLFKFQETNRTLSYTDANILCK